jgi:phenylpropionate dioxygenase-like ring-hydroxylating dioxygenase large terminal subunit
MTSAATFSSTFTTLPREFYLDGSLFEDELRAIWDHQWIYLGRVSDIPEPGDFLVRDVIGESVIVTRTPAGEIAAMLNVCRHRGARMIDVPCGRAKRIVCPYHQWTFDLDGRLTAAPSMPDGELTPYAALGLYPVAVETWGGFIFGCVGGVAPCALTPEIETLAPRLAEYQPHQMRRAAQRSYDCNANWKVMLENYMECYHCSASHPEFCRTADLRIRAGDEYAEQARDEHPYWSTDVPLLAGMKTASITGEYVCRVPLAGRDGFSRGESRSFGDWAGACVLYFYADHAMLHEIEPVSVTDTRFHLTWFVNGDATDEDVNLEELVHVWDATTRQDVELIERAQRGLRSRRYTPGPLSVRHEPYVHSSLNLYRAAMARATH